MPSQDQEKELTFEQALKQLEVAVDRLEQGDLPLDEALKLFEEGLKASNVCRNRLEEAKQRVEVLVSESGGSLQLTDLDTPGGSEEG
ncbi:MAG: exodeoxyribonuclease VII small subunit [Candidatus Latescibacteria bacterium]|jgi:exodeoxyribonuclease VII small subunit|nr:exodeoxyribonuclease VII small subunit [Candidatus Latescibacterota bacterium]